MRENNVGVFFPNGHTVIDVKDRLINSHMWKSVESAGEGGFSFGKHASFRVSCERLMRLARTKAQWRANGARGTEMGS